MTRFNPIDGPLSELAPGLLTIDLPALAENWQLLDRMSGEAECAAVVKADAYGIGLLQASAALRDAGARTFFVATTAEAVALRQKFSDVTIYVLNGLQPGKSSVFLEHELCPVLNSLEEIEEWAYDGNSAPAALHIDTGMNRLGLREEEAGALADDAKQVSCLRLNLIMSHLACADTPSSLMNGCQLSRFRDAAGLFEGVPRSLSNSAGIFNGSAFHCDLVRPGIALYGGAALKSHEDDCPMKPVVTVTAAILQIRDVKAHESVGYGAAETVEAPHKIAVVSAGYADGFLRSAGSTTAEKGASAYVGGKHAPLIGRVSMDMIAIDVTEVDGLKRGDRVELFGPNASINRLASNAGTISYEFLTGLGHRYRRTYKS
ncbi:MAG: alanine racemase [Pseudomonadota bacterium]